MRLSSLQGMTLLLVSVYVKHPVFWFLLIRQSITLFSNQYHALKRSFTQKHWQWSHYYWIHVVELNDFRCIDMFQYIETLRIDKFQYMETLSIDMFQYNCDSGKK